MRGRMRVVRPGDVIGDKYRVDRVLRADQDEITAVATDSHLEREVVLRVVPPGAGADDVAPAARIAARLRGDGVSRVLDASALADGSAYVAEEISNGIDLSSWLQQRGRLPATEAVDLMMQVCVALAEAHGQGLVHGDLAPSRLVLTDRVDGSRLIRIAGRWRLAGRPTASPVSTGHAAPEVLRGGMPTSLSDVWSLGACLYEILAGRPAMSGQGEPITPVAVLVWDLPEGLAEVVDRCLEVRPAARHAGIAELAHALAPTGSSQSQTLALAAQRLAKESLVPAGVRKLTGSLSPPVAPTAASPAAPLRRTISHSIPPFPTPDAPGDLARRRDGSAPPPVPENARRAATPAAPQPASEGQGHGRAGVSGPPPLPAQVVAENAETNPRARISGGQPQQVPAFAGEPPPASSSSSMPRAGNSAPPPASTSRRPSAQIAAADRSIEIPVEVRPSGGAAHPERPTSSAAGGHSRDGGGAGPAMSLLPGPGAASETLHGAAPAPMAAMIDAVRRSARPGGSTAPPVMPTLAELRPATPDPVARSAALALVGDTASATLVERHPAGARIAPAKAQPANLFAEPFGADTTTRMTRAQRKQLQRGAPGQRSRHGWIAYPVIALVAVALVAGAILLHRRSLGASAPEGPPAPVADSAAPVAASPGQPRPAPGAIEPAPAAVMHPPVALEPTTPARPEPSAPPVIEPAPIVEPAAKPTPAIKTRPQHHHHRSVTVKPTRPAPVKPVKPARSGDDDPFATPE
jgi:serine/threonine-protein kinase